MSTLVPKVKVVNVRSDDFIVAPLPEMFSDKLNQIVVDNSTVGQPERASWAQFVKHYEILFHGNTAVVAFFCLAMKNKTNW